MSVGRIHFNIGTVYVATDRLADARPHLEPAAAIYREAYGPTSPLTADAYRSVRILHEFFFPQKNCE